jgi:two-component system response regulator LytT
VLKYPPQPQEQALPERPAILIVEDEIILAKDLQRTLIELGYDAYAIASSAEAAMKRAGERRPDLVMMDIRIKGPQDGIQTAIILKKNSRPQSSYLTAHADEAMIERAKATEPSRLYAEAGKPRGTAHYGGNRSVQASTRAGAR